MCAYRSPPSHSRVTTLPVRPAASISATSWNAPHRLVPVEPPARRPVARSSSRIAASEAASGTPIIRSTMVGTNDGSTRGRPMPSMREGRPVVRPGPRPRQPGKKAEFSGSTTASRVGSRR